MVEIESRYENISQTSRLKVNNLQPKHSGNYSCLSPASRPAFTIVHVLNGNFYIFMNLFEHGVASMR